MKTTIKKLLLLLSFCFLFCGCGKKMDVDAVEKRIHGIVNGTEKYKIKEKGSEGGVDWFLTTDGMMIVTGDRDGYEDVRHSLPWVNNDEVVGLYFSIDNMTKSPCFANDNENLIYVDVSGVDTSHLVRLGSTFFQCNKLERIDGLENWDVSNVTDFGSVFIGCSALESLDLSGWDVSNGTDFANMFALCSSIKTIDVSGWDVSNGTDFVNMFSDCQQLEQIVGIEDWNMDHHVLVSGMFDGCASIKEMDLSNWCVEDRILDSLFCNCTSLERVDLRNFTLTEYAPLKTNLFDGCDNLKEVYLNVSFKEYLESDDYEGYVPDCIIYVD